jgi:hypothetical protein
MRSSMRIKNPPIESYGPSSDTPCDRKQLRREKGPPGFCRTSQMKVFTERLNLI